MLLYHMSDTLRVGQELTADHKKNSELVEPFVKALNNSTETFLNLLLNAEYFGSVLAKYGLAGMPTHEIKWATEGIFEYVRRHEFPECCSRVRCNYYYQDLNLCKELYFDDWGSAPKEERDKIRLFEVEVAGRVEAYDMRIFDDVFDEMYEHTTVGDIRRYMDRARAYYRGEKGKTPVVELIGDGAGVVKRDITEKLTEQ